MATITQEEARAHILSSHGLSNPLANPLDAIHGVFAIQTQYASSLPIALALRVDGLKPTWHKKSEHKEIFKCWTLRSTLHAHTSEDHAIAFAALRDRLRTRYVDWFKKELGFDDASIERLENEVCEALNSGPLTRVELHGRVPRLKEIPHSGWGLDLKGLAYAGRLKVIVAESGATRFALHECPRLWHKDEAIAELMRRYFSAYGPATLTDFRYWTGLFAADIKRAFALVVAELERIEVEGMAGERFLYGELAKGDIPRVALLAKFDPLTLGHFDKSLFLPHEVRDWVFRKAGQVEAGVLVDGTFAGTWRLIRKGRNAEVVVDPFGRISKAHAPALKREARKAAKSLDLTIGEVHVI